MTICDLCLDHVKTRYRVEGEKLYYVTNLLSTNLKKMTDDELLKLYSWIQEGITVCKDCDVLCKQVYQECHPPKNMKIYGMRVVSDKNDLQKIEDEVNRRTIQRKAVKKFLK